MAPDTNAGNVQSVTIIYGAKAFRRLVVPQPLAQSRKTRKSSCTIRRVRILPSKVSENPLIEVADPYPSFSIRLNVLYPITKQKLSVLFAICPVDLCVHFVSAV